MKLIDADAFKQTFCAECVRTQCENCNIDYHFEHLAPTVDIDAITESHEEIGYDKGFRDGYAQAIEEEVRHGHWIRSSDGYWDECSKCHASIDISMGSDLYNADGDEVEHDWCPHCGAKMDEVEDEMAVTCYEDNKPAETIVIDERREDGKIH